MFTYKREDETFMIKSADRALQILEFIAKRQGGLKHVEIAQSLNIPTSSLSGLLATMVAKDHLIYDKENRRYKLGPQVLLLATCYLADLDIVRFAQPIIKEVAMTSDESTSLAIKHGLEAMFVCKQESSHALVPRLGLGERIPLYATAVGKVILAYLSKEELDQYLSSTELITLTKFTITHPQRLLQELKSIRSKGIAISREEQTEGLFAMAAPIFDLTNQVVAGITVAIPKIRFNRKKEALIKNILLGASTMLSQLLGFHKESLGVKWNEV
jgi:DNA-binding IclR family transcriptional regulator